MPRSFDSSDRGRVVFVENVDCPSCGLTFEGVFATEDVEVEDVVDVPEAQLDCPGCNTVFECQLTGWHMHQESG